MNTILKKLHNKTPEDLLTEYSISAKPPVNLANLLEAIGILTISFDFSHIEDTLGSGDGSISGAAALDRDILAIFYRRADSSQIKRFTIAHELGQLCSGRHANQNEAGEVHIQYKRNPFCTEIDERTLREEHAANLFAEELLIPEDSLFAWYSKFIVPSLADLSKIFAVPASVMADRLDNLHLPYFKDCNTEPIV